jgi:hypothetical protein
VKSPQKKNIGTGDGKRLKMKINTNKTKILICSRYNNMKTRIKLKDGETI